MKKTPAALAGLMLAVALVGCSSDTTAPADDTTAESATETEHATEETTEEAEEPAGDSGTRDNPFSIGDTLSDDEWDITVTDINLDATDMVMDANQFNDAPDDGHKYAVYTVEATYKGSDSGNTGLISGKFVGEDGNTYDGLSKMASVDDSLDSMTDLYEGGSATYSSAIEVPNDFSGSLRVSSMLGDEGFWAAG